MRAKIDDTRKWLNLEIDIVAWLKENYSSRFQFRNSYQSIIGFPPDGFRSDGMITDGETLLAVEIEARQTHPDTNTGKYWLLHKSYKQYQKIVLFHVFTPLFDSYGWRKKLAKFYVAEMIKEIPIEYILKDFRQGIDYDDALSELKNAIQGKTKSALVERGVGEGLRPSQ
jgi:hypothetical protein